jgi:peptide-methionine (S)-S-oxide reductase
MNVHLKAFRLPGIISASCLGFAAVTLFTATGVGIPMLRPLARESAYVLPPPHVDEAIGAAGAPQVVVLAGGCFWGVQGVFEHVKGVISAVSGYAGGDAKTASYDMVSTGTTGHAESVRVTYDPRQITYGKILQIYFSVAHDPTQLNRQGPDFGTQYRSAIFPTNDEQTAVARDYIKQLDSAAVLGAGIVTQVTPLKAFYPAEAYHQDFLTRHGNNPYIVINDLPKVENLQRLFPDLYRADPVLAAGA